VEVTYHPFVKRDFIEALRYYHGITGALEDEFHEEVRSAITQAAANPLRFHLVDQRFHRANLRRFPYHILYEIREQDLRVMLIRHNKRHPNYGMTRK
jgi:plasmid stabilization system protein ParE